LFCINNKFGEFDYSIFPEFNNVKNIFILKFKIQIKMKKILILLFPISIFAFQACNEDKVNQVQKNGSIETSIQVDHLNDSLDVLISTNKVWAHNLLVKTTIHCDTIPGLGITNEEAENDEGETKNVSLKKDYELYITVK